METLTKEQERIKQIIKELEERLADIALSTKFRKILDDGNKIDVTMVISSLKSKYRITVEKLDPLV